MSEGLKETPKGGDTEHVKLTVWKVILLSDEYAR